MNRDGLSSRKGRKSVWKAQHAPQQGKPDQSSVQVAAADDRV